MTHPLESFVQRVSRSPEFQEKLETILRQTGDERISSLVIFSTEIGVPVSADDWTRALETVQNASPTLSDDDLADITGGGVWDTISSFLKFSAPRIQVNKH